MNVRAIEVIEGFKSQLSQLGLMIADASVYTPLDYVSADAIIVIAGYHPEKACLVTINATIHKDGGVSVTCDITAEHSRKTMVPIRDIDVSRNSTGGESYSCGHFSINNYCEPYDYEYTPFKTIPRDFGTSLQRTIAFVGEFLSKYGDILVPTFTRPILLSYAPWHTEECRTIDPKNEQIGKVFDHFARRIVPKFPKGYFAEGQLR